MVSQAGSDSSPTVSFVVVDVPCAECGAAVDCEVPDPVPAGLTAFCGDCRSDLLAAPQLPQGYDLMHELGRGGMGAVYLARHAALGLERAVKVILPQGALSADSRERFLQEARVHARLSHPRIVQIHDLSEVRPGVFAIVMEYVPGTDASLLLRRDGAPGLAPALAVEIAAQALEALAYVHARGIVHCDVKDPNLLVSPGATPSVKLSDFGLARTYAASGASSRRRQDVTSGTIPYMSPEQARNGPLSPSCDVYSLGATVYRLLSGRYAHDFPEGCDRLEVARNGHPVPLRELGLPIPPALAEAVDRALARDPAQRHGSAEAMRAALAASA